MKHFWWFKKKHLLKNPSFASEQTPCFVYDESTLLERVSHLKDALPSVNRINYAVKANPAALVLASLHRAGVCFDCVSIGEIEQVFKSCPGIKPEQIIFTPNFISKQEFQKALDYGVIITIDNLHPLLHYGSIFTGKNIFLRLDPEIGDGHHPHVKTGGYASKFGLSKDLVPQVQALVEKHAISVIGLHAHGGSGIKDPHFWKKIADFLIHQASRFPKVHLLDIGGGFAASETLEDMGLDFAPLEKDLAALKASHPGFELWIEPGRYVICESGILLARVTQIKEKAGKCFIGLETGMNSFIRQPLYGGFHPFVNLDRLDDPLTIKADIVGPICESADILGYDRRLPASYEGDLFCMSHAGAYGFSMSSNYNLRKPAKEFFLSKDQIFYEIPPISNT